MHHARYLPLLFLLAVPLTHAAAAGEDGPKDVPWVWKDTDLRKVDRIEKKLEQDGQGYWTRDEKLYFVKSSVGKRFAAELALYMDIFFDTFPKVFPMPPAGKLMVKMHVFVHKDRGQYMAATGAPAWSGGVQIFKAGAGYPIIEVHSFPWRTGEKEPSFCGDFNRGVLQHEGTHAMFQKFAGVRAIPVFFTEGCATYFESWDLRVSKPTRKERAERIKRGFHLDELVRKCTAEPNWRPSLTECLAFNHASWGKGDIGLHYALAESFMDFLLTDSGRRKIFRDMARECTKSIGPASSKELLTQKEIAKLEPKWHEHIASLVEERKKLAGMTSEPAAESSEAVKKK